MVQKFSFIIIILLCVVLVIGMSSSYLHVNNLNREVESVANEIESVTDDVEPTYNLDGYPPFILIDSVLYKHEKNITEESMNLNYSDSEYIGEITGVVPHNELPKKNFESNTTLLLGSEVYRYSSEVIIIRYDSCYMNYKMLE
jgi:hypothetical protein